MTGSPALLTVYGLHSACGWHAIAWAAGDLATGVYLYRLQAGGTEVTHKLAVIR